MLALRGVGIRARKVKGAKEVKSAFTHILLFPPGSVVTFTNLVWISLGSDIQNCTYRRLYRILFFARPFGDFFFSCLSTLGV